ncbi:MAG: peptidoglycan DD-metalloendopeptidase family protein [Candidatus Andersenbacteria bacterium]
MSSRRGISSLTAWLSVRILYHRIRKSGYRVYRAAYYFYIVVEQHLIKRLPRVTPRQWPNLVTKRVIVHGIFLSLVLGIAGHSQLTTGADRSSLLYTLVSGEEVIEGPLDPSAYAQTDTPGVGGARLAAVASDEGVDIITFDDPEVDFAGALGGNAVVGPLNPLVPEPGSEELPPRRVGKSSQVYTVVEDDTIATIAAKFDISANTILWANGLNSRAVLKVGDYLTILPTTGVLHTVRSGDTVSAIAEKYDTQAGEILSYNSLGEGAKLSIGQKLIVPDGYIAPVNAPQIVSQTTRVASRDADDGPTPEPAQGIGEGLLWPTTTKHISQYFRWGHTGIDIDSRSRPAIYAALPGTIEFAGWMGGYGNLIIMNHGGGTQTYYAHLDKFYVSKGAQLAKGAAIGQMGSTGRSSGPHLHFEVRKGGRPVNPLGLY